MKSRVVRLLVVFSVLTLRCYAQQNPHPQNATAAVLRAFQTHDIVMLGEFHGNKQEYDWLRSLVATPEFADKVDDIVMEFGNSLYQNTVDRYVNGEDVPFEQVTRAWRNTVGAIGPPSPVYASLYQAVREANLERRAKHKIRVLCGDPYIDWTKVKDKEDVGPYLAHRDQWYVQLVKEEVLAKHHRAVLIMGWGHFLRNFSKQGQSFVEQQLQTSGAKTFLIVTGTNTTGGYDDVDHRFDSWHAPAIISLHDNWVGELPVMPVITGGGGLALNLRLASGSGTQPSPAPERLEDAADALLYLGPHESLTQVLMPKAELQGTPYGREIVRRLTILGLPANSLPEKDEVPQFPRPNPDGSGGPPPLPPMPKSMHDPLPPRPASQ